MTICQWQANGEPPGTDPTLSRCAQPAPHRVQMNHYTAEFAVCPIHLVTALQDRYVQLDDDRPAKASEPPVTLDDAHQQHLDRVRARRTASAARDAEIDAALTDLREAVVSTQAAFKAFIAAWNRHDDH